MKSKITFFQVLTACSISLFSNLIFGQPGTLDPSFGTGGAVTSKLSNDSDNNYEGISVKEDVNHNIVILGNISYNNSSFVVFRYLPDGKPDSTFNSVGYFLTPDPANTNFVPFCMTIQTDGKIIIGGYRNNFNYTPQRSNLFLIRLNTQGQLDSMFGTNGMVLMNSPLTERANSVLSLPDGKIFVGGQSQAIALALRLNNNGTLDPSFAINGIAKYSFGLGYTEIEALARQTDGNIIAGGRAWLGVTDFTDYLLFRITSNGTVDSTGFNNSSFVTFDSGSQDNRDHITSVLLQSDGKIIVAGFGGCLRYFPNGVRDSSFADNGLINIMANDAAVQPDDKLIFPVVYDNLADNQRINIARYNPDGTIDSTFGLNGITNTTPGNETQNVFAVSVDHSGKILGTGNMYQGAFYLTVRYLSSLELSTEDFTSKPGNILTYPNPIDSQTTLQYELRNDSPVSIRLFDLNGSLISTCLDHAQVYKGKQHQHISFPASLPSGCYLLSVETDQGVATVKIFKR